VLVVELLSTQRLIVVDLVTWVEQNRSRMWEALGNFSEAWHDFVCENEPQLSVIAM
jgi:hypothetical protein